MFKTHPPELWCRELLCVDLLGRFKLIKQMDKEQFYDHFRSLEMYHQFVNQDERRDKLLQFLIKKIDLERDLELPKINIILILLKIEYSEAIRFLENT